MPDRARMIVWAERAQETLLRDAIDEANLALVAVGAPDPESAMALSTSLGVERVDDLRQAIQRENVDVLWLAAPNRVEADERRLIREASVRGLSCEPRPKTIAEVRRDPDDASTATFAPLMRRSPGFRAAIDAVEEFGTPQCVAVALGAGPGEGSLFARLFDAMDLLTTVVGPARRIDAALAGAVPGAAFPIPESTAELHGHLTLNVRFAEHRSATVWASDRAGGWSRRLTLLGARGRLRIDDAGYDWIGPDGASIETGGTDRVLSPGALTGIEISRLLENLDASAGPPPDTARLLALCEAARLSCRTGEGETPERVLEMLSRV